MSYVFLKKLSLSIVYSKRHHEYEKIFIEEESIEILKTPDLVNNDVVKKTEYNQLDGKVNNISTTDTINLVKKPNKNTKISEIENKANDHDHAKYITTQEFNKLSADNFIARLKQEDLASKNYIANSLKKTNFNNNKLLSFKKKNLTQINQNMNLLLMN